MSLSSDRSADELHRALRPKDFRGVHSGLKSRGFKLISAGTNQREKTVEADYRKGKQNIHILATGNKVIGGSAFQGKPPEKLKNIESSGKIRKEEI